ncbi:MAG TPA: hypothetical protein VN929_03960 [Burkholderiales bacterium]|nr:hypothetical protein [Burkholderiales bacterium]
MASRRDWLKAAALLPPLLFLRDALAQGRLEKGVYRRRGEVKISGDRVSTGADGELVFVIGKDAMLVRRDSEVSLIKNGLRIVTGALLGVFAGRRQLETGTAVIGIRGTAVYIEAERSRTYVCTCYGEAVLEPRGDPKARETVRTQHHEQPRYIMAQGAPQILLPAPVVNHTDAELVFLESLVGREPSFVGKGYKPY